MKRPPTLFLAHQYTTSLTVIASNVCCRYALHAEAVYCPRRGLLRWVWCVTGAHSSTAEVEHELMDLWNAVEKDKVVQAARRAAAARNKTRLDPAQPPHKKVPPL